MIDKADISIVYSLCSGFSEPAGSISDQLSSPPSCESSRAIFISVLSIHIHTYLPRYYIQASRCSCLAICEWSQSDTIGDSRID